MVDFLIEVFSRGLIFCEVFNRYNGPKIILDIQELYPGHIEVNPFSGSNSCVLTLLR